ncbi:MAG: AI-2E family transporter [Bacteroidales bacterium]|nr:AI-2E family transporter [Bacteroidales bacterium]
MKLNKTTILITLLSGVFIVIAYFLWKLWVYIIVASVISLILNPLNIQLKKIRIKKIAIPAFLRASFLLFTFWFILFLLAYFIFPLIINEIYNLASVNPQILNEKISAPIENIRKFLYSLGLLSQEYSNLSQFIVNKFLLTFNIANIQSAFSNFLSTIIDLLVAIFVITFIAFFFLKDEKLFMRTLLKFIPVSYQTEVKHVLICISKMLMRYFSGVVADMLIVFCLVSLGMLIVGCNISTSIILGIVAAIFNIIPYVGPIISFSIGMIVGFLSNIQFDIYDSILPQMLYMALVYLTVNIIDASIIQPYIYSNAIKAHPLEIFLVILAAGLLAGVIGMMLAIPSYMALRIIAKEFFYQFYIVKNLTKNM